MAGLGRCAVCELVDPISLIDLDLVMGDPAAWPSTLWGMFRPPAGDLPASYRRWGAVEMGLAWVQERGLPINRVQMRRHYRYDVPKIAATPEQLIENGLVASQPPNAAVTVPAKIDPLRFLEYYDKGIEVGIEGLRLLQQKIQTLKNADAEIPLALVKMAIDAGSKLAMSQAAIRAAGKNMGGEDDEDEGFRAGSAPAASPRFEGVRVREIEGVSRPIRDRGTADREAYTERATQEGGAGLPHR